MYENSEPEVIDEESPHLESVETDRSPAHIDSDPNVENSYSKQALSQLIIPQLWKQVQELITN